NLVRIDVMALRKLALVAEKVGPCLDVDTVGLEEVVGHALEAFGSVDFQWHPTPDGPGREDQVRVANRMVGVKVGDECHPQLCRLERLDTFVEKCGTGAPHNAGPEVHEVR